MLTRTQTQSRDDSEQGGANTPDGEARPFHAMSSSEALSVLRSASGGLDAAEARRRLQTYGPNTLTEGRRRSPLAMFLRQFTDFMILVLLAAAVISGLLGELKDAIAIAAILLLNAVVGFVQEYRAERALEALKAMAAPHAVVLRGRNTETVASAEVVPGDVVVLEAGAMVPADVRLLEVARLRIEEAALTGESVPVDKTTEPLPAGDVSLGDRTNMAYKGTTVTYGRGTGVVTATAMTTEFGKIAAQLSGTTEIQTPLQRRLAHFGRRLAVAALVVCAVVFVSGLLRGEPPLLMFMTAVSLAVAAIPEALPAVVTVSLALGARKMVQKNALVRKLPAVETLGSVTYVCSDKTGTLTLNRMRAEALYCDGAILGKPLCDGPWRVFLDALAVSNDAGAAGDGHVHGDPTEVALFCAARDAGFDKPCVERELPRVAEIPFDSERKCMTTVHRAARGGFVSFTKGAVEVIVDSSSSVLTSDGLRAIPSREIAELAERMASDGLRVLAVGMREWASLPDDLSPERVERDLTLLGCVGILDPPRDEARQAVGECRTAGIVPVMITGDHPATARAIAARVGILDAGADVLTGTELAKMSGDELVERVARARVYARVAPEQKLHIVRALQKRGEIVAMTGDGVNDAPALKQADIGVAMGITGTDVSKEASAMILLDDNFATIVRAVREGRRIYDNLRRFIRYAVTTNSAEVWLIFVAPFLGLPIPLLPIQILWVNLVSDGLPGLALAAEPEERDVMQRPPRPPQESVFAHGLGVHAIWVGVLMAALCIGTQALALEATAGWQTMVFTVVCFAQLAHVLAIRSEHESLFTQGLFSNRPLIATVALTFVLQLGVIYLPFANGVFKTQALSAAELAATVAVSSVVFWAVEAEKWLKRRRLRGRERTRAA